MTIIHYSCCVWIFSLELYNLMCFAALEIKNAESSSEKDLSVLEQYWKAVRDNPSDFTGWTYLLQYVEQEVCLDHEYGLVLS